MRIPRLAIAVATLTLTACMKPAETPEQAQARMQATTDSVRAVSGVAAWPANAGTLSAMAAIAVVNEVKRFMFL